MPHKASKRDVSGFVYALMTFMTGVVVKPVYPNVGWTIMIVSLIAMVVALTPTDDPDEDPE